MTNSNPKDPKSGKTSVEKNTISVDPGTLVLIIGLLILLPLLFTGFISQ